MKQPLFLIAPGSAGNQLPTAGKGKPDGKKRKRGYQGPAHYEGVPKNTPLPDDDTPVFIDHPAFTHDKYLRTALSSLVLMVAIQHSGQSENEGAKKEAAITSSWGEGETPILPRHLQIIKESATTVRERDEKQRRKYGKLS